MFTSSVAVYGPSREALTEVIPHKYISKYGESKSRAEHVYKTWWDRNSDRSLMIVRPTSIFGPGSEGNVHNLILLIKSVRFVMVGAGRNKKSIGYVCNVADFMVFVRSRGPGLHIFNYADKPDFTMRELVTFILQVLDGKSAAAITIPEWLGLCLGSSLDFIGKIIGAQFPINRERVEKFCSSTEIDAQNAFATGFAPKYTIEKSLQLTLKDCVKGSY